MSNSNLSNGNHHYEDEIEELKERIKELEEWNNVDQSTKSDEFVELQRNFHLLNERYRQLEIDYQRLQIQQKNNELSLQRLDEYEEIISQLQDQLDQQRTNEKKSSHQENIERQLNERIDLLEKEKIELCQQIESIQTTPGAPPTLNDSSDFISIYQQFLSSLPKEFTFHDDERISLVHRYENLFEQISSYIGTFSILQDEIESLKQILNEKQEELEKLQNDFDSTNQKFSFDRFNDDENDRDDDDDELGEILQLHSRTSSRQSLFSISNGEKQQLLAQNELLSSLLNEKEQELISLQQAEKTRDETNELRKQFDEQIKEKLLEIERINNERNSLRIEFERSREQIERLMKLQNEFEENIRQNNKIRVEKQLVKNILLSYFQTPLDKQLEVLPILGALVDFTQDDLQKAIQSISIQHQTNSSWFTGWLRSNQRNGTTTMTNQSFAQLLIEYVDQQSETINSTEEKIDRISSSSSIEDI